MSTIRPSYLADLLLKNQKKGSRHRSDAFLESLYAVYADIVHGESSGRLMPDDWQRVVPLARVYKLFTSLPGAGRDYDRTDFARDLYRLQDGGPIRTRKGATVSFPASSGTRQAKRDLFTFVGPDGQDVVYYGIRVHEGRLMSSASNTVPIDDWLRHIDGEYLSTFIKDGGSSIKFAVVSDDALPGLRDAVAGRCAALDYVFVALDAARLRVHMPQDIFFALARQVQWRCLARRVNPAPGRRTALHGGGHRSPRRRQRLRRHCRRQQTSNRSSCSARSGPRYRRVSSGTRTWPGIFAWP